MAIDALILTHKNINNAHHAVYTNADAVAAVLAGDDYLKLVGDTMGGAINMGANEINNASNYKVDAGDGNGLRFWDGSSSYSIYMSQQTDGTYGGRADSTSDYNIYFNITGDGVNRGFQFCDGLQNPYFAITPDDGVFSDVPLTMNSNIIMNANLITNSTGITFTDNVNSAITLEDHFTTDHRYHGTVIDIENGNLGFGLPGYISGDNAVAQADCDDASKMPCMGISVGDNKMLKSGIIYDLTYGIAGFAHGDVIYVSDAGILTKNRPGNAGDLIQVIGVMIDASTLDVHISLDMVEFV